MKIIAKGKIPVKKEIKVKFKCSHCGCIFIAEESECVVIRPRVAYTCRPNMNVTYKCKCPTCGVEVTTVEGVSEWKNI